MASTICVASAASCAVAVPGAAAIPSAAASPNPATKMGAANVCLCLVAAMEYLTACGAPLSFACQIPPLALTKQSAPVMAMQPKTWRAHRVNQCIDSMQCFFLRKRVDVLGERY